MIPVEEPIESCRKDIEELLKQPHIRVWTSRIRGTQLIADEGKLVVVTIEWTP